MAEYDRSPRGAAKKGAASRQRKYKVRKTLKARARKGSRTQAYLERLAGIHSKK